MGSRAARAPQADIERALAAARRVYGREVPIAIEPNGRIVILTSEREVRAANSFD